MYSVMEREPIKQLIWNLYEDQIENISELCRDGKSTGEIIRRIIDFGKNNQLSETYNPSIIDKERGLKKTPLNVTNQHYTWLSKEFPNRKMADGLRYIIDLYFQRSVV